MSSMFKKKGGLAFKPKAPVARPRSGPAPSTSRTAAPQPPQPTIDELPESTPEVASEIIEQKPGPPEISQKGSHDAVEKSTGLENELPVAPTRRTTRRSSQLESSSRPQIRPEASAEKSVGSEVTPATPSQSGPSTRTRRQSASKPPPQPSIETPEQPPQSEEAAVPKLTEPATAAQSTPGAVSEESTTVTRTSTRASARKSTTTNTTDAATPATEGELSRPKKRQRKTSRQDDSLETPAPRKRKTSTPNANGSRSSSRRARSLTPDDAEDQIVDLQKLKMSDLTRDLRIGKKFSRHDELRNRERQARLKAKLEKDGDTPSDPGVSGVQSPAPDSTNGSTTKPKSGTPGSTTTPSAAAAGPQFRIVDGQIVVDQSSLVMDRHARAAAARANEDMETIEENDFTRLITSSSFMNTSRLKGPNVWTDVETELFYRGLRMFGTEFEMISKMFPGKQRRHIKLKYNREERHNPHRIDEAVMGVKTTKMDIDEYRAFTGAEFESVETIEAEQRKIQEGYEAERQRLADEQAEIMRKKKEELFADEDGEEGDFKKKRKGKKKGKQSIQYGLNGEPITGE